MSPPSPQAHAPEGEEKPPLPPAGSPEEALLLERTWGNPWKGRLRGFLAETHHTAIGRRFILTAFVFFLLGGVEAALMRLQLARPEMGLMGPDLYNQLFTVHGSTMMFLFAVPVMEGMALYLVPLMVGSRSAAFPRLIAYGYWTYLIGGVLLYSGLLLDVGPDTGWFSYVPLAGPDGSPGKRVDIWAQMVTFTELSALAGAVNTIVTIFKHRAPGMSLDRMPLFVWAMLVKSFMVVFAMPAVMLASLMLAMDRLVGTHFFNHTEGGDALLWQHLFWFFGHPEVYIIFIPALGMLSSVIVTFTRRQMFGYLAMVLALVATGFIGFGVWVHHMFATGIPPVGANFFTAASILIALPTGVQFFCWIATLARGRLVLKSPMLWALGFFATFLIGGLSGVMLASVPIDLQVHDTYFVVAHFHYVLIGGAVFPLLAAVHYWLPKFTGRMPSERLGFWSFGFFFVGFHLVFFPMHILGFQGMPRRVFTYGPDRGWELNLVASAGAGLMAVGVLLFLLNVFWSSRRGAQAGDNPWQAPTLEWATTSPPPPYNFLHLPTVSGRYALWSRLPQQPVVVGVRPDRNEVLVTQLLDAEPDHRTELPGPTLIPFFTALFTGAMFIGAIFTPLAIPLGGVAVVLCMLAWFWPRPPFREELAEVQP